MMQARDLAEKALAQFQMAVRDTFTTLYYPGRTGLMQAEFRMEFSGNKYEGEKQVEQTLRERQKFTDDVSSKTFRDKLEQRLFTQQSMPWGEVKKRAAANPEWQWHKADALDALREEMLRRDNWREEGGYTNKGPFPKPDTEVNIQQLGRNPETGEVELRVTPKHGTMVYWDEGGEATTASKKLEGGTLKTAALKVSFLAVDEGGEHKTGPAKTWTNILTLKYRPPYQVGNDRRLELQVAPHATIKYTTDGSNPRGNGAIYSGDFIVVPQGTPKVLALAERDGIYSETLDIPMRWDKAWAIDPKKPARWDRSVQNTSTADTFKYLDRLKAHKASIVGPRIAVIKDQQFVELNMDEGRVMSAEQAAQVVEYVRGLLDTGDVQLSGDATLFGSGQDLLNWAQDAKQDVNEQDVKQ